MEFSILSIFPFRVKIVNHFFTIKNPICIFTWLLWPISMERNKLLVSINRFKKANDIKICLFGENQEMIFFPLSIFPSPTFLCEMKRRSGSKKKVTKDESYYEWRHKKATWKCFNSRSCCYLCSEILLAFSMKLVPFSEWFMTALSLSKQ